MKPTKQILFDAQAILKWTQKEPGYQKVKLLMIACRDHSVKGYMNQVNVGEVYYKTIRAVGIDRAKNFLENFLRLPIHIILLIVSLSGELLKLRRNMRFLLQTVLPLQPP